MSMDGYVQDVGIFIKDLLSPIAVMNVLYVYDIRVNIINIFFPYW